MNQKRSVKKILCSLVLAAAMLSAAVPFHALSVSAENRGLQSPVLQGVQREVKNYEEPLELFHGEYTKAPERAMNPQAKSALSALAVDTAEVKRAEIVEETRLSRTVRRMVFDNAQADFDEQGNLVDYINFEDIPEANPEYQETAESQQITAYAAAQPVYALTQRQQLDPYIEQLEEQFKLQDYVLVQCDTTVHESRWTLTWYKDCGGGLLNPYDNLTAFIDSADGSLVTMGRNTAEPNTTNPLVTERQTLEFAQPVTSLFSGVEHINASLTYFRPNFYWESNSVQYEEADFIRLAWEIRLDSAASVYIDALSGENLGGGQSQVYGRALCAQPDFIDSDKRIQWANSGLSRLGYDVSGGFGPWNGYIKESDVRWTLEYPNLTGFYIACHGNNMGRGIHELYGANNTIGIRPELREWRIPANTVDEIFHFVFLDACSSSNVNCIDSWRTAFHIGGYDSDTAFVGWNIDVDNYVAADFCQRFWNRVNSYTIYNCVILSLTEGRELYGVLCNPGFSGDTGYYGRAW